MKNVSKIIPCYAADTSGVCSALYELGGMTVVHDASGCNSTYSTHDEPRWYDMRSKIYISALTELDAIMGNDEKLISDAVSAAADQNPEFIAVCGSPMPMMTGVDFDAIAMEIENRSGIRTFALHTNGTRSYIEGASEAFLSIVREYVCECEKSKGLGVNILGATPLDLSVNGSVESIKRLLSDSGFEVISCLAMGSGLCDIRRAAQARVNLVVSYSGYAAAEYMYRSFGIPYVCGVPAGKIFSAKLIGALKAAAESGECAFPTAGRAFEKADAVVIGESVYAASIAAEISASQGKTAAVISPLPTDGRILAKGDLCISAEEDIECELAKGGYKTIIADPLYRYISPKNAGFIGLPHFAFSGRCFAKNIPNLIDTDFKEFFE